MTRIAGILLAAGDSTRMGTQKLLLPVGNESMIERIARVAMDSGLSPIVAVTGRDNDAVAAQLGDHVRLVRNPDPARGMLSSIRVGLEALPDEVKAVVLFLGDQPGCTVAQVKALIASDATIAVPTHEGRRGHPLLFSMQYREAILTRYDDTGLRGLLHEYAHEVCEIPLDDEGVLIDVDTPDEYEAEVRRQGLAE